MDLSEGIDSSFQLLVLGGELCDSIWADVSKSLSAPLSVIDLPVGGLWARDGYHTLLASNDASARKSSKTPLGFPPAVLCPRKDPITHRVACTVFRRFLDMADMSTAGIAGMAGS